MWKRALTTTARFIDVLVVMLTPFILLGCGGSGSGDDGGTLTLVAYSTPREAYEELTSAFADTEVGQGFTAGTTLLVRA